jgi:zinc transport system substrate-binding protein
MRKLAVLLLLIAGCDGGTEESTPAPEARGPAGVVEVTHYPMEYIVSRIGGSRVEVRFRAREATDPAYWRPTTEDVVAMQEADLIVVNGAGYEPWLVDVSLPVSRLVDTTAPWSDRLIALEETVTHSHGPEGDHEHGGTAFTTWLDLSLLARQTETVAEALKRRWPEHEAEFGRRAGELIAELETLDAEFATAAAQFDDRTFAFSHPLYQYMQARYGLKGASVHWEPDVTPSAEAWNELAHLADHGHRVDAMIWEGQPTPETLEQLAERGVAVAIVEPHATAPAGDDFMAAMRSNLEALRALAR